MKKNVTLSIPHPCREKWETFSSTADGGYCSTCQNVVIDFSKMTDEEIADFLIQRPRHACGRFRVDQLRSYVYTEAPKLNTGMTLLKAGMIGMVLLLGQPLYAQHLAESTKTVTPRHLSLAAKVLPASDTSFQVKGVVRSDEDQAAMAGVTVILQGSPEGTATDTDGRFAFPKKLKPGDVLLFSFVGVETQEFTIPDHLAAPLEIRMKMNMIVLGELQVDEQLKAQGSGLRRLWTKVRRLF